MTDQRLPRKASIRYLLVAIAIVIAVGIFVRSETGLEKLPDRLADAVSVAPKGSLRPEAVLAITPRSGSNVQARPEAAARLSPLLREYRDAKELKPIHQRLSHLEHPTGEEQWMLASILQNCARVAEDEPD